MHWAKTYLVKAGLAEGTRRGYFRITPRGATTLAEPTAVINNAYLEQFKEFQDFKTRVNQTDGGSIVTSTQSPTVLGEETPDEHWAKAATAV